VVGCSAEGTPDGEALGTASQAYTGSFTPTGTGVPSDLQFSGEFKLSASRILVIGGYQGSAGMNEGVGQTTAGIITNTAAGTGTWTRLVTGAGASNPLPTGLGEVEIAQISASKFLVAGGRATRDGVAVNNAWVLTLVNTATGEATWSAAVNMSQARVIGKNNLQKCGTASRFIALGGITNRGMNDSTAALTATDKVEVFYYNGGAPAWNALTVAGSSPVQTAYLKQGQGYHHVLHVSDTSFRVAGGATAAAEAIVDTHKLQVDNDCKALSTSVTTKTSASAVINTLTGTDQPLPSARARGASIKSSGTISGIPSFSYDFVLASGNDATNRYSNAPPTAIFFYDSSTDKWKSNGSLGAGRVFGRLVQDDAVANSTSVKMGTGVAGNNSNVLLYNTTTAVDIIDNTGTRSAGTAMTNSRVGSPVQLLTTGGRDDFAALGTKYTNGTPAAQSNVEGF